MTKNGKKWKDYWVLWNQQVLRWILKCHHRQSGAHSDTDILSNVSGYALCCSTVRFQSSLRRPCRSETGVTKHTSLKRHLHDNKAIYCFPEETDLIPESSIVATVSEDYHCGSASSLRRSLMICAHTAITTCGQNVAVPPEILRGQCWTRYLKIQIYVRVGVISHR